MTGKELVRKAIEFDNPPRLPFWIGSFWAGKISKKFELIWTNVVCSFLSRLQLIQFEQLAGRIKPVPYC